MPVFFRLIAFSFTKRRGLSEPIINQFWLWIKGMMEGGGSELSRKSMQLFLVFIRKVGQYFEGFSIEIMLTGLRACCNVYLYFLKFS